MSILSGSVRRETDQRQLSSFPNEIPRPASWVHQSRWDSCSVLPVINQPLRIAAIMDHALLHTSIWISICFRSLFASFFRLSRSIWILCCERDCQPKQSTKDSRCSTYSCLSVAISSFMRVPRLSTSRLRAVVAVRIAAVSFLVSMLVSERSSDSAALNNLIRMMSPSF